MTWGCPVVEVAYIYEINNEIFSGSDEIPFICHSSAGDYVLRNPQDSILSVRVKPQDPQESIMETGRIDHVYAS
jgi:hypothetical protein